MQPVAAAPYLASMPLYKEWEPARHTLAAIWHIEELEAYFSHKTGITPAIRHPRKRIEYLCGRYLLQHLRQDFPLRHIAPDAHDKPRLPDNRYFFSISHSHPYVAAIISDKEECGIDIQVWKDNIADIAHMYLSEAEQAICNDAQLMTLAWTAKEAAYKWWGRRGAGFIRDLPIHSLWPEASTNFPQGIYTDYSIGMECFGHPIGVKALLYKHFAISLIAQERPADVE